MRPVVRRKMGYWLFPPPSAHDLGSGNVFADLNLPRRGATAWSIAVRLNALLKAEGQPPSTWELPGRMSQALVCTNTPASGWHYPLVRGLV